MALKKTRRKERKQKKKQKRLYKIQDTLQKAKVESAVKLCRVKGSSSGIAMSSREK